MELNEKLQELRKKKGLTQEEVAQFLYVSRTAVSKWESGRGIPNIDSLKAISKFYSISLDDLLSSEALMHIAEDDRKQREIHIRDLIFGLLDSSSALLLLLPFFGMETVGEVYPVSLLMLKEIPVYLRFSYFAAVLGLVLLGIATLTLQNWDNRIWKNYKSSLSLLANIFTVFLFLVSRQVYAAIFVFVLLLIKGAICLKRP